MRKITFLLAFVAVVAVNAAVVPPNVTRISRIVVTDAPFPDGGIPQVADVPIPDGGIPD